MIADEVKITYIGGSTALLEIAGLRLLTDPTFDAKDSEYTTSLYTLTKLSDPTVSVEDIGYVDAVLLSHDHHFDNLDNKGRQFLHQAENVYTTVAGAERIGGAAKGLNVWESVDIATKDERTIRITATPCRHGPANGDRGPVIGFILNFKGEEENAIYITGDTVWYEGVAKVAERFDVGLILMFMGAAKVKEIGPDHLTMTVDESIIAAKHFPKAKIFPMHFEGWAHFSEPANEIKRKYEEAGLKDRLLWPDKPGTEKKL